MMIEKCPQIRVPEQYRYVNIKRYCSFHGINLFSSMQTLLKGSQYAIYEQIFKLFLQG